MVAGLEISVQQVRLLSVLSLKSTTIKLLMIAPDHYILPHSLPPPPPSHHSLTKIKLPVLLMFRISFSFSIRDFSALTPEVRRRRRRRRRRGGWVYSGVECTVSQ